LAIRALLREIFGETRDFTVRLLRAARVPRVPAALSFV